MTASSRCMSAVLAIALVASACAGEGGGDASPPATRAPKASIETASTSPPNNGPTETIATATPDGEQVNASTVDLARSVVQIVQLDERGDGYEPACFSGSGVFISAEGQILTNAHVIEQDPTCTYDRLGIGVFVRSDQPPQLSYLADVLAFDQSLDLAVIGVVETIDGSPLGDFPAAAIGDSDTTDIGQPLRILGYPGIGGETITLTEGSVSGFTLEGSIDGRAWIKTDAAIAGGSSGGPAMDAGGAVIGISTIVGAGASGDIATTDCRLLEDTNGDGRIDGQDSCVSVGGFINGLRPINLARDVIAQAAGGAQTPAPATEAVVEAEGEFGPLQFTSGIVDERPVDDLDVLDDVPAEKVCASWEFSGMSDGAVWDAVWSLDGEVAEEASFFGETWSLGATGGSWVCFIGGSAGLDSGLYELALTVSGDLYMTDTIYVGDDRPLTPLTVSNEDEETICFLNVSDGDAGYWGPDRLRSDQTIATGESVTLEVPAGIYDVRLLACDGDTGNPLAVESVSVDAPATFTYSG